MRNKGAILTLAIAMTVVCIYQLSFTLVAEKIRSDAKENAVEYTKNFAAAHPNTNKESLDSISNALQEHYLDSLSGEQVFDILLKDFTLREVQEREINFGLDLKGGMNVILEISTIDVLRSLSGFSQDAAFNAALIRAKELQKTKNKDFVTLFGEAFDEVAPNASLAAIFTSQELRDKINYNTPNSEVIKAIKIEAEGAIKNAFNIITTRIDQFGVIQPNIQQLETNDRILVDLPGVKNKERVRKLLQGTANLEFWETFDNSEIYQGLYAADEVIKNYLDAGKKMEAVPADTNAKVIDVKPLTAEPKKDEESTLNALIEKEDTSKADKSLADEAKNYPLLRLLNPYQNQETRQPVEGAIVGIAHSKDTVKINEYLKIAKEKNVFPREAKFLWAAKTIEDPKTKKPTDNIFLYAIKVRSRDGQPLLGGDVIVAANIDYDQATGDPQVSMKMNSSGATIWANITKENKGKIICIVLDDRVYSGPVVNQEITGGNSQISGNFTIDEAQDLANLLKSGKLPAPAHIIQENVVGPSLGQRAIDDGLNSFLIAFVVIMAYMIFYYSRSAGLVADIALFANMFFLMGVLASISASLTLPGIAGIVLTIGMSVDANVLIYERIRDELAMGKGLRLAIADGFKNALSAIIDGNLTTVITGIILYVLGTGPIKGFATTLIIGICTSLFSAIFITRIILEKMLSRNKAIIFDTKATKNFLKTVNFKFIEKRNIFYVLSSVFIIISVGSLVIRGLDPGVDFSGGRNFIIKFETKVNPEQISEALTPVFGQIPKVITFGKDEQVRITTRYKIDEVGEAVDEEIQHLIYNGLKPVIGERVTYDTFFKEYWQSNEKVGPSIADDVKRQAVWAILLAFLAIFLYIVFRFRKSQYGLGAIVALIHDALMVLGVFSLFYGHMPFSLEADQSFVAAVLTVIGYSINDTVVIFDRIREYIGLYPKRDRKEIMNMALNSTLARTLNTSFTVLIVLIILFIFGGEVIRGFVFAMLIGVISGTYSTVFIATPIVYDCYKKPKEIKK